MHRAVVQTRKESRQGRGSEEGRRRRTDCVESSVQLASGAHGRCGMATWCDTWGLAGAEQAPRPGCWCSAGRLPLRDRLGPGGRERSGSGSGQQQGGERAVQREWEQTNERTGRQAGTRGAQGGRWQGAGQWPGGRGNPPRVLGAQSPQPQPPDPPRPPNGGTLYWRAPRWGGGASAARAAAAAAH